MQILEIGSGEMSQPRRKVASSVPLERSETRKKKKSSSVPRVESRQHLRTAATRKALLEAAMNVFVRDGFEASRIEDIAAEAGRSRGAFYVNFSNKAEAFFALREQRFLTNEARFRKKLQGQTTLEEQRQAVEEYMVEQVLDKSYTLLELEFKLFAIRHPSGNAAATLRKTGDAERVWKCVCTGHARGSHCYVGVGDYCVAGDSGGADFYSGNLWAGVSRGIDFVAGA